jgi:spore maturation protein CgeB
VNISVIHNEQVSWSISDVRDGLCFGLRANGHTVTDDRSAADWFIVVNPMFQTPEQLAELRTLAPVAALCTETPYDIAQELRCAGLVDGGWTHERVSVPAFQKVNPNFGYLPHAWHPERHGLGDPDPSVPAHDVVLVGSGFGERIAWINAMDWTGIDLGLYGIWHGQGLTPTASKFVRDGKTISNVDAVKLYRRATIGLNLYRTKTGRTWPPTPARNIHAESLSPRSYELAACGVFQISNYRKESEEKFGLSVPFNIAQNANDPASLEHDRHVIQYWLRPEQAELRAELAKVARKAVRKDSWTDRAAQVVADLKAWSKVAA